MKRQDTKESLWKTSVFLKRQKEQLEKVEKNPKIQKIRSGTRKQNEV